MRAWKIIDWPDKPNDIKTEWWVLPFTFSPNLKGFCIRVPSDMIQRSCVLLIAVLACGVVTSAAIASPAAAPGANSGRLIIYRAATLGSDLLIDVNIDGVIAGTIGTGQTYTGSLSPGKHVVSVTLHPKQANLSPTSKTLMVEGGKTYAFTAKWQGQSVVLR